MGAGIAGRESCLRKGRLRVCLCSMRLHGDFYRPCYRRLLKGVSWNSETYPMQAISGIWVNMNDTGITSLEKRA